MAQFCFSSSLTVSVLSLLKSYLNQFPQHSLTQGISVSVSCSGIQQYRVKKHHAGITSSFSRWYDYIRFKTDFCDEDSLIIHSKIFITSNKKISFKIAVIFSIGMNFRNCYYKFLFLLRTKVVVWVFVKYHVLYPLFLFQSCSKQEPHCHELKLFCDHCSPQDFKIAFEYCYTWEGYLWY